MNSGQRINHREEYGLPVDIRREEFGALIMSPSRVRAGTLADLIFCSDDAHGFEKLSG